MLERFAAGWCVTDLGSSNGTFLNGERIWAQQRLRHGDEIRVGRTRLLFRNSADVGRTATEARPRPPTLTARERDVLVVLCRPLLDRDLFTEPASIKEIAAELVVSEAAVKQHLANLYDKFEVGDAAHPPPHPPGQRGDPPWRGHPRRPAPRRGAVASLPGSAWFRWWSG